MAFTIRVNGVDRTADVDGDTPLIVAAPFTREWLKPTLRRGNRAAPRVVRLS
jgi:hypothetical protein